MKIESGKGKQGRKTLKIWVNHLYTIMRHILGAYTLDEEWEKWDTLLSMCPSDKYRKEKIKIYI
jgi:hypothetical protein